MSGSFRIGSEVERDELDWGGIGWFSRPPSTGARQLTVMEVTIEPGFGHDFHKHPDQEEVIYVRSGRIEQWLEREKSELGPGDAVFIPADTVHASFTVGDETAELLVSLGPCVGEEGYELVDVASDEPWSGLRG
jgi:quercetin dioxygenase-like cupin family protein